MSCSVAEISRHSAALHPVLCPDHVTTLQSASPGPAWRHSPTRPTSASYDPSHRNWRHTSGRHVVTRNLRITQGLRVFSRLSVEAHRTTGDSVIFLTLPTAFSNVFLDPETGPKWPRTFLFLLLGFLLLSGFRFPKARLFLNRSWWSFSHVLFTIFYI